MLNPNTLVILGKLLLFRPVSVGNLFQLHHPHLNIRIYTVEARKPGHLGVFQKVPRFGSCPGLGVAPICERIIHGRKPKYQWRIQGGIGGIYPSHQTFGLPVFRIHSDYYFSFSYYIFNHVFDL